MGDLIDILLVDDESRNLDALEAILVEPEYRLIRAEGADRALHLLLTHDVAAIVLDIKMPGLSGFELAKLIKGSKRTRQIPIVFLTAHLLDDHDVLEGYGAGAVDYLTKPVNPQILRHKIAAFADLFRKTRQLAELNEELEERVRARTAELAERERELRAVTDNTPDLLMRVDRDLRAVWLNPAAQRAFGVNAAVSPLWKTHLEAVFANHERVVFVHEDHHGQDATPRFYSTTLVPEIGDEGEVEHVLAVTHDLTESVHATHELRASEARLQMSLDAGRMGRFEIDERTGLATIDPTEAALLGLPAATRTLEQIGFYEMVHADDRAIITEALENASAGDGEYQCEFRVVRPDGRIVWLSAHGQLIRDAAGRPVSLAGVHADVTERRSNEEALRGADKQKDEFLATLAHELRNPLAPLRTGLGLLKIWEAPPAVDRTITIMDRQLDHMVRLIDDLLDVSRISRGMLELKKERAKLSTILETALDSCRPLIEQRHQKITVEASLEIYAVVDPTRLAQIVGNLLHNAAKYTPEGGEIRVHVSREGHEAIVRVIDTGVGIPGDMLERVFDMFARVDRSSTRSHGGLGIGLALARRLAEMHGGTLSASSQGADRGSTFTLRVPTGIAAEVKVANDTKDLPAPNLKDSLDILVIEDNVDAAETMALWLEHMGHTVRVAHTGHAGLELVLDAQPQLVLCDLGLPEMDGLEVCRRVRASGLASTPIMVALTGWGMDEDRRRTQAAGFDHHLVKPVAPDRLRELLIEVGTSR